VYKIPVSALIIIHTRDLQVLLLERADHPGYWQSVTGSQDPGESLYATAVREVREETGLDAERYQLSDWDSQNVYEIYAVWRHRYPPGTTHNTEHAFGLLLPEPLPVQLAPREHLRFIWLPWQEAAAKCFSWSNREAILRLPARMGWRAPDTFPGAAIRHAHAGDVRRVREFCAAHGQAIEVPAGDEVLVAEISGQLAGVASVLHTDNFTMLRSMHIAPGFQRRGVGTALLRRCGELSGDVPCFSVASRELIGFHGREGFTLAHPKEVPPSVAEQLTKCREAGTDAVAMVKGLRRTRPSP
jgi:dATP pyrophosphohydrolase